MNGGIISPRRFFETPSLLPFLSRALIMVEDLPDGWLLPTVTKVCSGWKAKDLEQVPTALVKDEVGSSDRMYWKCV